MTKAEIIAGAVAKRNATVQNPERHEEAILSRIVAGKGYGFARSIYSPPGAHPDILIPYREIKASGVEIGDRFSYVPDHGLDGRVVATSVQVISP